jgi:hypothetical protein
MTLLEVILLKWSGYELYWRSNNIKRSVCGYTEEVKRFQEIFMNSTKNIVQKHVERLRKTGPSVEIVSTPAEIRTWCLPKKKVNVTPSSFVSCLVCDVSHILAHPILKPLSKINLVARDQFVLVAVNCALWVANFQKSVAHTYTESAHQEQSSMTSDIEFILVPLYPWEKICRHAWI